MTVNREANKVTEELLAWITLQVPKVSVAATAVGQPREGPGIALALVRAVPCAIPLSLDRKRAVLALDYLVTVSLSDPLAEHSAVASLAFAALESPDIEIAVDYPVSEACRAIGLAPSAGLVLRTEARRERVLARAPLVRELPIVSVGLLAQAEGTVIGPNNIPIAGAIVTLDGSNRQVTTGPDGRFRFAVPEGTRPHITARARSREITSTLTPDTPSLIPLPMEA